MSQLLRKEKMKFYNAVAKLKNSTGNLTQMFE